MDAATEVMLQLHRQNVEQLIAFFESTLPQPMSTERRKLCKDRFDERHRINGGPYGSLNLMMLGRGTLDAEHYLRRAIKNLVTGDDIDALNLIMIATYVGAAL